MTEPCAPDAGRVEPIIDRGRCEAKADCVGVCPYHVFDIRRLTAVERQGLGWFARQARRPRRPPSLRRPRRRLPRLRPVRESLPRAGDQPGGRRGLLTRGGIACAAPADGAPESCCGIRRPPAASRGRRQSSAVSICRAARARCGGQGHRDGYPDRLPRAAVARSARDRGAGRPARGRAASTPDGARQRAVQQSPSRPREPRRTPEGSSPSVH